MEIGKYADGRALDYDQATGRFDIGGAQVTPEQVIAYDRAGQLAWATSDLRNWAYQFAANVDSGNATPPPKKGWFSGLPLWAKVLLVLFAWPFLLAYAIFVMWKEERYSVGARIAITAMAAVFFVAVLASGSQEPAKQDTTSSQTPSQPAVTSPEPAQEAPAEEPAPATAPTPAEPEPAQEPAAPTLTVAQEQAVQKAESYLEMGGFSKKSLIKQLEFEGFSGADSRFAVDHIAPNWNAQAVLKAKSYMEMGGFSKKSLIQQLEFEGFTAAQAKRGAKAVGY